MSTIRIVCHVVVDYPHWQGTRQPFARILKAMRGESLLSRAENVEPLATTSQLHRASCGTSAYLKVLHQAFEAESTLSRDLELSIACPGDVASEGIRREHCSVCSLPPDNECLPRWSRFENQGGYQKSSATCLH